MLGSWVILRVLDAEKEKPQDRRCESTENKGFFMAAVTASADIVNNRARRVNAGSAPVSSDSLVAYSAKDAPWDVHRAQADRVSAIYAEASEFERTAQRIHACSGALFFAWLAHEETGELVLRLREARFCRVRYCPVCQWRRSLMHQARFLEALPKIQADYPSGRWLFLTLTVRNCSILDLGQTLTSMNKGWHRLVKRPEFKPVTGWIRSTEVTRGADGSSHPHFHALLMVPPGMLSGRAYVPHARWVSLWRETARLDYDPVVRIQAVKPKRGRPPESALRDAVSETLKYSVKPADMIGDAEWFLELTRQTHRKRFLAAGGVLKNALKQIETETDLIHADDAQGEAEDDGARLAFAWRSESKRYRRAPDRDKEPD